MVKTLEEYALEQEQKENEWHDKYDKVAKDTLFEIDLCLKEKSKENISRLYDVFTDESVINIMNNCGDFILVYCFMTIYAREIEADREVTILDTVSCIEDIKYISRIVKYQLWRYEFWNEKSEAELLVDFFVQNKFTPECIVEMIGFVSYDKVAVLEGILEIMMRKGKYVTSLRIIEFARKKNIYSLNIESTKQEIILLAQKYGK